VKISQVLYNERKAKRFLFTKMFIIMDIESIMTATKLVKIEQESKFIFDFVELQSDFESYNLNK
jgi:hypothetical protein